MTALFFLFMGISTCSAILASLIFGALSLPIAVGALSLAGVSILWLRPQMPRAESWTPSYWDQGIVLLLSIWVGHQFLYLFYSSEGNWHFDNANNLGDLPMHFNMIKSFARGLQFWPENLEWAGEKLRYPFAINMFNALFEILGMRTQAHLILVGLICGFLLIRELWLWGGAFLLLAFFWSGGFKDLPGLLQGRGPWPMSGVEFKNLFLAVFVTQRGFLFALPVGIYILRAFTQENLFGKTQERVIIFFLAILPIFHLHSFLFLGLYLGVAHFFHPQRKQWFRIGVIASLLALPWVAQMLFGGTQVGQALGWSPGWTYSLSSASETFAEYFLQNFAPLLVMIPLVCWAAFQKKDSKAGINLGLLLLFFCVRFAPWSWDNIKLLIWAYLVLCFDFYRLFLRGRENWQLGLGLLFFFPGFFQMLGSFPARSDSASPSMESYWLECEDSAVPVNEAVLTTPDFDHPLLFSGVKMVMGFEGHVWSHGYNVDQRRQQIQSLLQQMRDSAQSGSSWQEAAKELGAKWLYQRQNEPSNKHGVDPHLLEALKSYPACRSRPLRGDRIYDLSKTESSPTSTSSPVRDSTGSEAPKSGRPPFDANQRSIPDFLGH